MRVKLRRPGTAGGAGQRRTRAGEVHRAAIALARYDPRDPDEWVAHRRIHRAVPAALRSSTPGGTLATLRRLAAAGELEVHPSGGWFRTGA